MLMEFHADKKEVMIAMARATHMMLADAQIQLLASSSENAIYATQVGKITILCNASIDGTFKVRTLMWQ